MCKKVRTFSLSLLNSSNKFFVLAKSKKNKSNTKSEAENAATTAAKLQAAVKFFNKVWNGISSRRHNKTATHDKMSLFCRPSALPNICAMFRNSVFKSFVITILFVIVVTVAGEESDSKSASHDEILIVPKPSLIPTSRVLLPPPPPLLSSSSETSSSSSLSLSSSSSSLSTLTSQQQSSLQQAQLQQQLNRQQNLIDSIFPEKRFDCKTTVVLNDTHGFIKTPDYSSTIPVTCRWIIHGRRNDSRIVLHFERLHLVNSLSCNSTQACCANYLRISSKNREETFCSTSKDLILSVEQNVTIDFYSEFGTRLNNFYLSYDVYPKDSPKCRCQCANGDCLSHETQICNRKTECPDGSDEAFCLGHKLKRSKLIFEMCRVPSKRLRNLSHILLPSSVVVSNDCTGDRYHCHNGRQCIARSSVCDGEIDCFDHSDETNCTQFQCPGLVCDQTRCISNDRVCDQIFDCNDARDEEDCIRNSFITATLTASLICGLILVVAVGCGCKLFHWRNLQQFRASLAGSRSGILHRNENFPAGDLDATLFRMDQTAFLREPPPSYASTMGGYPDVYGVNQAYMQQYRRYRRARRHRSRRSGQTNRFVNGICSIRQPNGVTPDVVPIEAPRAIPETEEVDKPEETMEDYEPEQEDISAIQFQQQLTPQMALSGGVGANNNSSGGSTLTATHGRRIEQLELVPPPTPSTPTNFNDCDSQPLIRVSTP